MLRELARTQRELGCALIVISHNLGLISRLAHRVLVLYLGRVLEQNGVRDFVRQPRHPYSRALLAATPSLEADRRTGRLAGIRGLPAQMIDVPPAAPSTLAARKRSPAARSASRPGTRPAPRAPPEAGQLATSSRRRA